MDNPITIKVTELIGSTICISVEDGQKVFDKVLDQIKNGRSVIISFERVSMLISLFLNVAIGQLYGSLSEDEIRAKLSVNGLSEDDLELLKRVVENAKRYYANPKKYDEAWQNVGEEGE